MMKQEEHDTEVVIMMKQEEHNTEIRNDLRTMEKKQEEEWHKFMDDLMIMMKATLKKPPGFH
jgi:hypothetical protein